MYRNSRQPVASIRVSYVLENNCGKTSANENFNEYRNTSVSTIQRRRGDRRRAISFVEEKFHLHLVFSSEQIEIKTLVGGLLGVEASVLCVCCVFN